MPDRYLVAGGAGFLGSHLCERLLDSGERVYCLDNLGSGQVMNVEGIRDDDLFTFMEADIRKETSLPEVDAIYHLASRASPEDFTGYPVRIALTNTKGTRNLLDHAAECDARMLYASTSEVYGDPEIHPQPESYNGNVNIRGKRGCYDESKRFGETLTVAYHEEYDLDVRTVRIFNTYGPRMRVDDGRAVPTFINQALRDRPVTVYGDGTQTRSFCYVSDLIAGLSAVMTTEGLAGEVVNLGNDAEITINDLAETIVDVCNSRSSITYQPLPEDDPERRQPDLTKATKLLNWEPHVGLRDGLERTIDYFESIVDTR